MARSWSRGKKKTRKEPTPKKKSRALLWLGLFVLSAFFGVSGGLFLASLRDLPQVKSLEEYRPSTITWLYAADNRIFSEFYRERRIVVPLSKIPQDLKEAILAVEDSRFYQHRGVDPLGILRAVVKNLWTGRIVEGGSTITQQLAKVLFLTPERSLARKLKEATLALLIESRYTKDEILELYCNQIYMGSGAYGMEAAAQTYFAKSVSQLNLGEAALLAGLPKAPSRFSPLNDPDLARKRMLHVLGRMEEQGYITKAEAQKATAVPVKLTARSREKGETAYFVEYIRQDLEERYGSHVLYGGGLKVYTTLDLEAQRAAYQALREGLRRIDKRREAWNGERKENGSPEASDQKPPVEGALLAIDPRTGQIKAMVGGYDFTKSEFNRAVQAKRQPGSAFKPFIYLTAIAKGFTPSDIILDLPVSYAAGRPGEVWQPKNFTQEFYGPNTLRSALEHSRNVSTVRLLDKVGVKPVIDMAHRMGVSSPLHSNLSLALGTAEVSLLELTSAYGVLANLGVRMEPTAIRRITDEGGKVLQRWRGQPSQVVRPDVAYVLTDMLKGVVERGTGRRAQALGRPAAAKTGTTDNAQDTWFIGYTPQLVAGVWVGYDDQRSLGRHATGGQVAAPIWVDFMMKALAGKPAADFIPPERVVFREIDAGTGLLATPECREVITEAFLQGSEPTRYCSHDGEPPMESPKGGEEF